MAARCLAARAARRFGIKSPRDSRLRRSDVAYLFAVGPGNRRFFRRFSDTVQNWSVLVWGATEHQRSAFPPPSKPDCLRPDDVAAGAQSRCERTAIRNAPFPLPNRGKARRGWDG